MYLKVPFKFLYRTSVCCEQFEVCKSVIWVVIIAILLFYPRNQSERETVNICTIRINDTCSVETVLAPMLCISEIWKSKPKIEVAANVLGFPLLKKVDVTWLEGERRKMRYMEPKNTVIAVELNIISVTY